ncbi:hypothetical protein VDGL01_12316 [Verticillium dahliae]
MRKAVHTIVLPKALFGTEIRYPGPTRPGKQRVNGTFPRVRNGLQDTIGKLQVAINSAIRGALPVWKTTPIEAMLRESSTPPIQLLLDMARTRHALRLGTLDKGHPLVPRILNYTARRNRGNAVRPTILTEAATSVPLFPRPILCPRIHATPPTQATKEEATKAFNTWTARLPLTHLLVFTDVSQIGRKTGYGYAVYQGPSHDSIRAGCRPLPHAGVFDAEAEGARAGLVACLQNCIQEDTSAITVCLDNTSVIWCLNGTPPVTSQEAILDFRAYVRKHHIPIDCRWSPGHMNIMGNEMADQLAKRGASKRPHFDPQPTFSHVRRLLRKEHRQAYEQWWLHNMPTGYAGLKLEAPLKPTAEIETLTRRELHWVIAARTGHGDFEKHHRRFNHEDAKMTCSCGAYKTPAHPLFCRKANKNPPWLGHNQYVDAMLGLGWPSFVKQINHSSFFDTTCTRYRERELPTQGHHTSEAEPYPTSTSKPRSTV